MPHIVLIDGSNMLRRAYSVAVKEQDARGIELGATALFSQMLAKLFRRMEAGKVAPSHAAIFFDPVREGTWRRKVFPAYKADRDDYEEDYLIQVGMTMQMCDAIGLRNARFDSHEADDLLAAMTSKARHAGMRVSIISTDKDLMQLVGPGVMQFHPMQDKWFGAKEVLEKFGVGPDLLTDYMALTGDSGDGIPGAPGIGPKIAAEILQTAGSLDAVLEDPDLVKRKSAKASIENNRDLILMSRRLVSFDVDSCPPLFAPETAMMPKAEIAKQKMEGFLLARLQLQDPVPAL